MKHTVFLAHGMGLYQDGWHKPYVDAIHQTYDRYPLLAGQEFEERFEFAPITYDQIFRDIVKTWADNAALIANLPPELGNVGTKLTAWLKNAGELKNDNFKWTHAADVLLYKGFRTVREAVCANVAKQLTTKIKKQHDEFGASSWSVVAHSLGTAVIHDTLARLSDPQSTMPGREAFSSKNEQARLVMMVANVSRVLETKTTDEPYDAYLSVVKPGFPGQPGRVCRYFLNPRHRLDPFTVPSMFNPSEWPDPATLAARPPRYAYVEVDHIHDPDVHSFAHYLSNPKVHIPMFRMLTAPEFIPPQQEKEALDGFTPFGSLGQDAGIKILQYLEDILPKQSELWTVFGMLWKQYSKA